MKSKNSLKQDNKKHKSKPGSVKVKEKGKVNKAVGRKLKKELSKQQKKQRSKQLRNNKTKELTAVAQSRGGKDSPPLLCALIPLSDTVSSKLAASILQSCDPDAQILKNTGSSSCLPDYVHFESKRMKKRLATVTPQFHNMFACLDAAKVADWVIFLCPNDPDELEGDYTEQLMSSLYSQGLPASCYVCLSGSCDIKSLKKFIQRKFPEPDVRRLFNSSDGLALLRHVCMSAGTSVQVGGGLTVYRQRSFMLVEDMALVEAEDGGGTCLQVSGSIRGRHLDVNSLVHLTGWGDMRMSRALDQRTGTVLRVADPYFEEAELVESDVDEGSQAGVNDLDDFEMESDDETDEEDAMSVNEEGSDIPEESDDDEEEDGDEKHVRFGDTDTMSVGTVSGYSAAQLAKFREARQQEKLPDEVNTPVDMPCRDRFSKYRGLASLRTSKWPLDEDLPLEYRKIHRFRNYRHDRNRLMKTLAKEEVQGGIPAGTCVSLVLTGAGDVCTEIYNFHKSNGSPLVLFSLLKFEHRMSVVHMSVKRLNAASVVLGDDDLDEETDADIPPVAEPIRSKETMLFQAGFRRFEAKPLYSELCPGENQRFLRFLPTGDTCVASVYGPVMYAPVPVLQFRVRQSESPMESSNLGELVATGSLLSVDPDRPIIKRILLTGHACKVHKRGAVVRFMFHSPEDVTFFKPVELHTKNGRRGQIKESMGTHGLMKCQFDRQIASNVVLMPLYKRVFPKWSYQPQTSLKFS